MSSDKSFPCPSCGAGLEWTPGTGLKCPFCGFQGEPEAATATARDHLKELRLDQAALTAATGYGTATKALTCSSCGATSEHPPEVTTTSCPFCGSHHVESLTELTAVIRPSSVLPFGVDKDGAIGAFRGWLSGLWFRPSALKSAAQLEHIVGVYIPAWTFDAQASSQWTAEAGHHYHVEETVTEVVDGKQVTRQKQVRKTRWEPAHGDHHAHYDDQLVQASGGLDQAAIKQLQPYPLEQLQPYDTRFLAGFQAERYKVDLAAAWRVASDELESMEESACRKQVPGDTQRNLARVDRRLPLPGQAVPLHRQRRHRKGQWRSTDLVGKGRPVRVHHRGDDRLVPRRALGRRCGRRHPLRAEAQPPQCAAQLTRDCV
jgi:DNA-directed RNA polymerase subunit RPC12/RpoP